MKITGIDVYRISLPLIERTKSASAGGIMYLDSLMGVLVKVHTDDNMIGLGTAATVPAYAGMTQDTIVDAIKFLSPYLIGLDPFDIEDVHTRMDSRLVRNTPPKSALDMALYDIMGKAINRPVHQLLGGRVRKDFITDRAIFTLEKTPEQIGKDTVKHVEEGYRGFEVHVGSGFEEDVANIRAIRDAGKDLVIVADAHQHWSVKEAIRTIKALEKFDVIIEQPVRGIENMAEVKRAVDATITADEACFTVDDAISIVQNRAADAVTVKVPKAGGLYPAKKIVTIAEAAGLQIRIDGVPGDTMLSNSAACHLATTIRRLLPGSGVMQHRYYLKDDVVAEGGLIFKDGRASVDDKPAFGIKHKENLLTKV
ncbi:MAG: hypothetical protein HY619_03520 [Thaumarchaeota archaeon]|nr:hypothetical protein [Nitrososphaerota archaeon]